MESNHFVAKNWAMDGNPNSHWASDDLGADNALEMQWLELNLGGIHFIDYISLQWEWTYSQNYEIQISDIGIKWDTMSTFLDGRGSEVEMSMLDVRVCYVRIFSMVGNSNYYRILLYKVKIFGNSDVDCTQGVLLLLLLLPLLSWKRAPNMTPKKPLMATC
jgi:hypothetical protein